MNDLNNLIKKTEELLSDKFVRTVATTMLGVTSKRIFTDGKDANGGQIGTYSKSYAKQRSKKGLSGGKVILELTGQMRNDFSVVSDGKDTGLGFKNPVNAEKSRYVEKTYNKKIFAHTPEEEKQVIDLYGSLIERHFRGV